MKGTDRRRRAFQFFLEHAGYATPPGRAVCALELARAEELAQELGYVVCWEPEMDPAISWMSEAERQEDHEVEGCGVAIPCGRCGQIGRPVASLGNIVDADADYRRVVEAELFAEVLADRLKS